MPDSGSGAVTIPVINQTVETPTLGRPRLPVSPFHAEAVQSDAGSALSSAGKSLLGIFAAQQQHADAIDVAQRMGQFEGDLGQAKVKALNSGQTGPEMVAGFQADAGKLMNQYTNPDPASPNPPPNHAVARQLAVAMNQHVADQMGSFPSEAAERVAHDLDFRFQQQNTSAAGMIGQNYTIGGTADAPTFQLNADGLSAMNRQAATIDAAYDPKSRPTENAYYRNDLAQKAVLQTGMAVAQDHPTLIGDFLKQHAGVIPPEQQMQLMNRATQAINLPMKQINANNDAVRAQFLNQWDAAAQKGTLDINKLTTARQNRMITEDDFEQRAHYPFMNAGNPGAIATMNKQISSTTDENDLETLKGAINGPENAELYGKGAIPLNAAIENQKRNLQTVEGQQRRSDNDQIKRAFRSIPGVGATVLYNRSAPLMGVPTLAELRANAIDDYNAATFGIHDPAKLAAARAKAINDNQPDLAAVGLAPKAAASPAPPSVTDAEALKAAAIGRKLGLVH